jgi:hypothetical protein
MLISIITIPMILTSVSYAQQSSSFVVDQDVCISGYITCSQCNVGDLQTYNVEYNVHQTMYHPTNNNLQCLVANPSCVLDGFEVATKYAIGSVANMDDEESDVFCRSFKLDYGSSSFISSAGKQFVDNFATSVVVGGFPVSFNGKISSVGNETSLPIVAMNTLSLSMSIGGCSSALSVADFCILPSGAPTTSPSIARSPLSATLSPATKEPTNAQLSGRPTYKPTIAITETLAPVQSSLFGPSDTSVNESTTAPISSAPTVVPTNSVAPTDDTTKQTAAIVVDANQNSNGTSTNGTDDGINNNVIINKATSTVVTSREMEIQQLFKTHGKMAGIAWGILLPLAMATAWLRDMFPSTSGSKSFCCRKIISNSWLVLHLSLTLAAAVMTSLALYCGIKALSLEGGSEFASKFDGGHNSTGLFLVIGIWVQVLGGIIRPRKNTITRRNNNGVSMRMDEEANDPAFDDDDDDDENNNMSDIHSESESTVEAHVVLGQILGYVGRSIVDPVEDPKPSRKKTQSKKKVIQSHYTSSNDVVTTLTTGRARKYWGYLHRALAMALLCCGTWQVSSGFKEYQDRYGDASGYLETRYWIWVGSFWGVVCVFTFFFKKF